LCFSVADELCLSVCVSVQFKTFSQRVEEIDIDVYRSLHAVKAEPSSGSSFFLDALNEWRVCGFLPTLIISTATNSTLGVTRGLDLMLEAFEDA
jgi:hypothetical protein